ncbi:MAG: ankyrin repeat domain-containing protein [Acidobacteriota bacterium]|nr:ankyrin repeat domain-containing protein [Acidobacteriota bacterium]
MKKAALALLAAALSLPAFADDALGTLTVNGKTTILKAVAATEEMDAQGEKWLVILASDRKVEGDRSIARLAALAKDGQLHAVRILWQIGSDMVRAVPYDANLPESGRMGLEHPTLDLKRYGKDRRLEAEFKSKMVGQAWHFHANVRANVVPGGILELEPEAETLGAAVTGGDPKLALGKLGYAYNEESFPHAITDANLDAVRLFLEIGMSPNARGKGGIHPMLLAAMGCGQQDGKQRSEVLEALTAAHGDVKAKDDNGSTALLWAVQGGCSVSSVQALLKAGSDPNVRAKGGATPLMYAEIFKRTEIEAVLKKAGAKK